MSKTEVSKEKICNVNSDMTVPMITFCWLSYSKFKGNEKKKKTAKITLLIVKKYSEEFISISLYSSFFSYNYVQRIAKC